MFELINNEYQEEVLLTSYMGTSSRDMLNTKLHIESSAKMMIMKLS